MSAGQAQPVSQESCPRAPVSPCGRPHEHPEGEEQGLDWSLLVLSQRRAPKVKAGPSAALEGP